MSRFRRWLGRVTGTHIFHQLPRGIDLSADLERWLPRFQAAVVFDVGAHHGQSARSFLRWFPAAQVYCFEPVTGTFRTLSQNLSGQDRVHCLQLALGAAPGRASVRLEGSSDMYGIEQGAAGPAEEVTVATVDRLCQREGIARLSLLKIDTEGHDLAVLEGAEEMVHRQAVDLIQVEAGWHPENRRHVPAAAFKAHLEPRGYRLFGIYQQKGEWPSGEPHLRRADLVFVSGPVRERGRQDPT
jgi:FkbM family methyltransferase